MNLEGSDILKNNLESRTLHKKYNGVFPTSLLLDKLMEFGLKINNGTTRDIVTVKFTYGYTPLLDSLNKDIINNLKNENEEIKNKIESLKEEKTAIKKRDDKKPITEKINELKNTIRLNKQEMSVKRLQDNIAVAEAKIKKDKIREKLYKDGFRLEFKSKRSDRIEIIQYVFFYRTPSKSRVGDVVFINKKLLAKIKVWQRMGLELPEENAKLVEMAAYEALTSSNIVDRIVIDPKSILVISDLKSFFKTNCAVVKTNDTGECYVSNEPYEVSNTLFDGQALLDSSLFTDNTSFKLLRQHFFKACAFRTNIKKFMMDMFGDDYDTAMVKDRYGNNIKVSDILLITTENAMKWEKFRDIGASYELWKQKVTEDGNIFGVAKVDHVSKYNNLFGDGKCYQRMSYQHVNTLYLDDKSKDKAIEEMTELLQDTLRFIDRLKSDNKYFLQYLERTANEVNANHMVIDLCKNVGSFNKSAFYRDFKAKAINNYVDTVRQGKVLCSGDNLTIVGNPYTMLLHAIGRVPVINKYGELVLDESYQDETLPISNEYIAVYAPLFEDGECLASFRNPHNAPNNTGYNKNYKHQLMEKYFKFSNNVMAVNMIKTEEQDLKNGEDQDSDFCYVTNNRVVVKSARRVFRKYPCIVNNIKIENDREYKNTLESLAKIDNTLANSRCDIGVSSNLAQLAMSWYWKAKTDKEESDKKKTDELADIVCVMSVLAQCAIDNAKRQYAVNIGEELKNIAKRDCMKETTQVTKQNKKGDTITRTIKAKPMFWKRIDKKTKDRSLIDCPCPMNYLQQVIDAEVKSACKEPGTILSIDFVNIFPGKSDDRQESKIMSKIKEYDDAVKAHNVLVTSGHAKDDKKWRLEDQLLQKEVVDYISGLKLKPKTMQRLISKGLKGMNGRFRRKLLNGLYKADRDKFMSCFKAL